jgi:hypothetical protein
MGKAVSLIACIWDAAPGASALPGVEYDYSYMSRLLNSPEFSARGFSRATELCNRDATAANLKNAISEAAFLLDPGDMFVFYYSGHGSDVQGNQGDELRDQVFVTWDHPSQRLVDNDLPPLWASFRADVRIFAITDSCHSGTAMRAMPGKTPRDLATRDIVTKPIRPLSLGFKPAADGPSGTRSRGEMPGFKGTMIHFAGCADPEVSQAYSSRCSSFTKNFLDVLPVASNYAQLFESTKQRVQDELRQFGIMQTAQMNTYGAIPEFFASQKPFGCEERWPPI